MLDTRGTGCASPGGRPVVVGGCVPVTKPGGDDIWRMTFTNTGNLPQDKVYAIDRLPTRGDTGAITSLERGSQWKPIPKSVSFAGVTGGTVSAIRLTTPPVRRSVPTTWTIWEPARWGARLDAPCLNGTIDDPVVGGSIDLPVDATAIEIQTDFADDMFQLNGVLEVELTTTAPAQSPTSGPDTIAWNTVAVAAETDDGGSKGLSPKSEGNKVGVALATGPLEIEKVVDGPAAEFAPDSFGLTVQCTSVGEEVDLGDRASITVEPGVVTRIDDIPWGSECTVSEDTEAAGDPDFAATSVTIVRDDQTVPIVIATNTYPDASSVIEKEVDGSAVDADGNPITYGPFTFDVSCTYLGEPVYAEGFGPESPMTATFDSDESVTFTELPAGADCTATEIETDGAASTTSEARTDANEVPITGDTTIDLVLTADGDDGTATNEVTFTNTFATGSVIITKTIEGEGAELADVGPFFVAMTCVDADGRTVFDGETQLGGDQPLTVTVDHLFVDSTCEVTETGTGGATTSVVSPEGPFPVTADSADEPVQIAVTNTFDLGSIRLIKQLEGGGADDVAGGTAFTLQLECQVLVNDEIQPVELEDDGVITLTTPDDLEATYTGLPTGARAP